jgi:hypothetical protein
MVVQEARFSLRTYHNGNRYYYSCFGISETHFRINEPLNNTKSRTSFFICRSFSVMLIVGNSAGGIDTVIQNVNVLPNPSAQFTSVRLNVRDLRCILMISPARFPVILQPGYGTWEMAPTDGYFPNTVYEHDTKHRYLPRFPYSNYFR